MSLQALDDFSAAWHTASTVESPPTLAMLGEYGAPLDHPGFAVFGHCPLQEADRSKSTTNGMFRIIQAIDSHGYFGYEDLTGRRLDELFHPAYVKPLLDVYNATCQNRSLHRWRTMSMDRNAQPLSYTRVLAAIADDVGDGRCLAGLWILHMPKLKRDEAQPAA